VTGLPEGLTYIPVANKAKEQQLYDPSPSVPLLIAHWRKRKERYICPTRENGTDDLDKAVYIFKTIFLIYI